MGRADHGPERVRAASAELSRELRAYEPTWLDREYRKSLAKWNPKPYGMGIAGLYEYTLGPLSRVIARCQDVSSDGSILLVAATLTHDHPRIKRLIDGHRTNIKSS
jgi:hypothetical protein